MLSLNDAEYTQNLILDESGGIAPVDRWIV